MFVIQSAIAAIAVAHIPVSTRQAVVRLVGTSVRWIVLRGSERELATRITRFSFLSVELTHVSYLCFSLVR